MALDIFIKLGTDGSTNAIKGESIDAMHKGEIEAAAISWGYAQHVTIGSGSSGAGRVEFQEFHFTKSLDSTSPALYAALSAGKHFDKVTVSMRKGGAGGTDYAHFTLATVFVTSVDGSASSSDDLPIEDVGLAYGGVVWQVGGKGTPAGWSRVKNGSVKDLGAL